MDWSTLTIAELQTTLHYFGGDGHTIYSAAHVLEAGVPHAVVDALTTTYKSEGNGKQAITVGDQRVDELRGIYGLQVLWSLAGFVGVSSDKSGRGFQAQQLTTRIAAKLLGLTSNRFITSDGYTLIRTGGLWEAGGMLSFAQDASGRPVDSSGGYVDGDYLYPRPEQV